MNKLPEALLSRIIIALERKGDDTGIMDVQRVSGGCIHQANRIVTRAASYFLKWNEKPQNDMFISEAKGLRMLGESNAVRVPQVFESSNQAGECPAYILMEWVEPPQKGLNGFDQVILGKQLAQMHKSSDKYEIKKFGLDENNYIGENPQKNFWKDNWTEFFRDNRLAIQVEIAARNNVLPRSRRNGLQFIMDNLDSYLGSHNVLASLLHGDLWAGNVIPDSDGNPVLLDPAVYFGDRETDLAFSELFSGFGSRFYAAYADHFPIEVGYQERKQIYNLYHLLNHLNHFGEMYGRQIDSILSRYLK